MTPESAALLNAIRGPVMMITIGVLFALDNYTPVGFSKTWPVLLVVAGILNLGRPPRQRGRINNYQTQWAPPQPAPPPPAPPATPAPSANPTSGPGTYRGSTYESAPGASTPPRENKERPQ